MLIFQGTYSIRIFQGKSIMPIFQGTLSIRIFQGK